MLHFNCGWLCSLFLTPAALAVCAALCAQAPVDWVNPYIGTGAGISNAAVGYGGSMPLVTTPFGMTNWTARTRAMARPGTWYNYADSTIEGIVGTHQPAEWMGDYGFVTLMPEVDSIRQEAAARKLPFRREDEFVRPYLYKVKLDAGLSRQIGVSFTATDHCGYIRFKFPATELATILVEATRSKIIGSIEFDPEKQEITGYNPERADARFGPFALPNFRGYFVVQLRERAQSFGTYTGDHRAAGQREMTGDNVGAWVSIPARNGKVVEAKVGTSFISIEQARKNLSIELPSWNFDRAANRLRNEWNRKLSFARIEGTSQDQKHIFYTALYHALLYPKLFSENGRYYSAFDDKVHDGEQYTAYSIWDTFRAEHSLLTLAAPERVDGMMTGLLHDFSEGGWMPKWPNPSYTNIMIATHADSLVAEAAAKGFHGFDRELAWQAVYKDAMTPPVDDEHRRWLDEEEHTPYEARGGLTWYMHYGFIPADKTSESASSTIEDSYDDWCVAQFALLLGKDKDYHFFLKRSLSYRNLFDPATNFFRARNSDGSWANPEDGWTEGDQWVYNFAALHDIPGIIKLMGGKDNFDNRLDDHFNGHHNQHDNEPSHHYAYLYDYGDQPWKTQAKVREIATTLYANRPDGLAGDDDCGQMSAWYIFSALGFYPLNPASTEYVIGAPLYRRIDLHLADGHVFSVRAPNVSKDNIYIQSVRLNDRPLRVPIVKWRDLQAGGTLEFDMGPSPSNWASDWQPASIPTEP